MIQEHELLPYAASRLVGAGPALVLAPHPDDEVFGCAGALCRHAGAGDAIAVVIVTDGAHGGGAEVAAARQRESQCAARALGYGTPRFWGHPDRGLAYGEPLVAAILEAIGTLGARLVYAPSWWEVHPDHLTLSLAAAEAVRRAPDGVDLVLYEVGVPLHPNLLLDITDLLAAKAAAMACFVSQLAQQPYDEQITALNRFRTYTLPREIRAAEAYRRVTQNELRDAPRYERRVERYHAQAAGAAGAPEPELAAALAEARGRLAALHASTSWRLTAPLRALVEWRRRRTGGGG